MHYLFSNRHGGYSKKPFDTFNLGLHVGDDPLLVKLNRKKLLEKSGAKHLVFMEQVHGTDIKKVSLDTLDEEFVCDGLICEQRDIALCVMVADCIPLLFFDAKNQVIGVAHAGRAGSYGGIASKMCERMKKEFDSNPKNLEVKIGPCIRACCYEVQEKDIKGFEEYAKGEKNSFYLDLVKLNKAQLLKAGVLEQNIQDIKICTCCNKEYFSYRREKKTGRFCGLIAL